MGGKSNKEQTVTQTPVIPGFLKPGLHQSANVSNQALSSLSNQLGGATSEDLVAGFTPDQQAAFDMLRGVATGGQLATGVDALEATARGDFLAGGPGFNQAVDAAVRAAQPHIMSTFGRAGPLSGGLVQAAIAQQATDAFARQFGNERRNQLGAIQALPGLLTFGPDLLGRIGTAQQDLNQRGLLAPISAQTDLLSASRGGLPLASLIGQRQSRPIFDNSRNALIGGGLSLIGSIGGALAGGPPGAMIGGSIGRGLANSTITQDAAGNIL